jgi:hypothetical protein
MKDRFHSCSHAAAAIVLDEFGKNSLGPAVAQIVTVLEEIGKAKLAIPFVFVRLLASHNWINPTQDSGEPT